MNPSEQRYEDRPWKRLAAVEKQLHDIKTAQRMGLDNFVYDISDVVSSHFFLNSGEVYTLRLNFIAEHPAYFASELSVSFFMNNDLDPDYHWPDGAAVTTVSGLRPFDYIPFYDLYNSDELGAGRKTYYLQITNMGVVAKTVHMHAALVFPKSNLT
jgi:hypothetical protein